MYYSEAIPDAVGEASRLTKAKQIHAVIKKHCAGRSTANMALLDYGTSTGLMASYFAGHFRRVVGVDVDRSALAAAAARFRSPNLAFLALSDEQTMFRDGCFDVVVANQVYNCIDNQPAMFREIHRVLKPGGFCFLGARNKYALLEAQYNLLFLSMLPAGPAKLYLKLFRGTTDFVGSHYLSHAGIRRLAAPFKIYDYTLEILKRPAEFGFDSLVKYARIANLLPLRSIESLIPNYVMILEKP
jgi:ubiquinone/menaquinone biosynthesis C-methylase UbiE